MAARFTTAKHPGDHRTVYMRKYQLRNFQIPQFGFNAWFNSTCYHPPRAYPREFAILFSLGGLFPTPGHTERDNSPPPGLLIDHKYLVLCTRYTFSYSATVLFNALEADLKILAAHPLASPSALSSFSFSLKHKLRGLFLQTLNTVSHLEELCCHECRFLLKCRCFF